MNLALQSQISLFTILLHMPKNNNNTYRTRWVVSRWVACVMQYLTILEVERGKALHKQQDLIQLTGSTQRTSIPFIIYIDKEDKTHLCIFRYFSFQVLKSITMFYNKVVRINYRIFILVCIKRNLHKLQLCTE